MLFEPSTLSSTLAVIGETVERLGSDPQELYRSIGVDAEQMDLPGWRVPLSVMQRAWVTAHEMTGDDCFGLHVAETLRPGHLHAFGLAWLASSNVLEAMRRLERYQRILSTSLGATFERTGDEYRLALSMPGSVPDPGDPWPALPLDAFFGVMLGLCRILAGDDFAPIRVELVRPAAGLGEEHRKNFRAPVVFAAPGNAAIFRRSDCTEPVIAGAQELSIEVDGIAERYLRSMEMSPTVTQLHAILVDLLPSGGVSQEAVAQRLHTSVSTLQRQLRAEGSSYRAVLDKTRRELALHYVADRRYTLSEIAFLLGFADQASMSRAFKRWTGTSPKKYADQILAAKLSVRGNKSNHR